MEIPGIPPGDQQLFNELKKLLKGFTESKTNDSDSEPDDEKPKHKQTIEAFKVDVSQEDCHNPRDVHEALQTIFTDMISLAGRLKKVASQLDDMIPASIKLTVPQKNQKMTKKQLQKELEELQKQGAEIIRMMKKAQEGDNE